MPKFIFGQEKNIVVKIQERERKTTAGGNPGYRHGHGKSITIRGDVTVEEIHHIICEALKKASKKKVDYRAHEEMER